MIRGVQGLQEEQGRLPPLQAARQVLGAEPDLLSTQKTQTPLFLSLPTDVSPVQKALPLSSTISFVFQGTKHWISFQSFPIAHGFLYSPEILSVQTETLFIIYFLVFALSNIFLLFQSSL